MAEVRLYLHYLNLYTQEKTINTIMTLINTYSGCWLQPFGSIYAFEKQLQVVLITLFYFLKYIYHLFIFMTCIVKS